MDGAATLQLPFPSPPSHTVLLSSSTLTPTLLVSFPCHSSVTTVATYALGDAERVKESESERETNVDARKAPLPSPLPPTFPSPALMHPTSSHQVPNRLRFLAEEAHQALYLPAPPTVSPDPPSLFIYLCIRTARNAKPPLPTYPATPPFLLLRQSPG